MLLKPRLLLHHAAGAIWRPSALVRRYNQSGKHLQDLIYNLLFVLLLNTFLQLIHQSLDFHIVYADCVLARLLSSIFDIKACPTRPSPSQPAAHVRKPSAWQSALHTAAIAMNVTSGCLCTDPDVGTLIGAHCKVPLKLDTSPAKTVEEQAFLSPRSQPRLHRWERVQRLSQLRESKILQ